MCNPVIDLASVLQAVKTYQFAKIYFQNPSLFSTFPLKKKFCYNSVMALFPNSIKVFQLLIILIIS